MELKQYLTIPYYEFNELARKLEGVPDDYDVVTYEEMNNDNVYEVLFDGDKPFSSIELRVIKDCEQYGMECKFNTIRFVFEL